MKKLTSLFSTFFLLVCAGCATNDRIVFHETGEITLNSEVKTLNEIVELFENNQLNGQTPVFVIQEDGNSRQSTVDEVVADIFEGFNKYYFPEGRGVESPDDPFFGNQTRVKEADK